MTRKFQVQLIAIVTGRCERQVRHVVRTLREDGEIPTSFARGSNAAAFGRESVLAILKELLRSELGYHTRGKNIHFSGFDGPLGPGKVLRAQYSSGRIKATASLRVPLRPLDVPALEAAAWALLLHLFGTLDHFNWEDLMPK